MPVMYTIYPFGGSILCGNLKNINQASLKCQRTVIFAVAVDVDSMTFEQLTD